MERYLVFTYYIGRSLGGMNDYLDSFPTVEEATDNLLKERDRYYQIVDAETMAVVKEGLTIYKDISSECFSAGDIPFEDEDNDFLF